LIQALVGSRLRRTSGTGSNSPDFEPRHAQKHRRRLVDGVCLRNRMSDGTKHARKKRYGLHPTSRLQLKEPRQVLSALIQCIKLEARRRL
jgi:hypothetical protein